MIYALPWSTPNNDPAGIICLFTHLEDTGKAAKKHVDAEGCTDRYELLIIMNYAHITRVAVAQISETSQVDTGYRKCSSSVFGS